MSLRTARSKLATRAYRTALDAAEAARTLATSAELEARETSRKLEEPLARLTAEARAFVAIWNAI